MAGAGISFFETMSGVIGNHPAMFEVKVEATGVGGFLKSGRSRISGILNAPPWADHVSVTGTLHISGLRKGAMEYELYSVPNELDEPPLRLAGSKDLRQLNLVAAMTRLPVELSRAGEVIATGELQFNPRDIASFVGSWRLRARAARQTVYRPLADGSVMASRLSKSELLALRALVEATIAEGDHTPAADSQTVEATHAYLMLGPDHLLAGYRWAMRGIDVAAVAKYGRRFADLSLSTRIALLEDLSAGPRTSRLVLLATAAIKVSHFSRDDYLARVGAPQRVKAPDEPKPRWMSQVSEPEDLDPVTRIDADVVIIGTGAGGAVMAAELAAAGMSVAIVEEGRYHGRADFAAKPQSRVDEMWRWRGMNAAVGTPILVPQGRTVGGTTTINSGTCLPTPDSVLQSWIHDLGFPKDFAPGNYQQWSDKVAKVLQVTPGGAHELGQIAPLIGRGADAMGLSHGPLPRNAPACTAEAECIFGCPTGAKLSTDVTYIPKALSNGAMLFTGLPVTRILMAQDRAVAIEARGSDSYGVQKRLYVHADHVVVAAGSLLTPVLLMDNGFHLPRLGRNLSLHPAMGLIGRTAGDLDPWHSIPQGYGVTGHGLAGVMFEGFSIPPGLLAAGLPWTGKRLSDWMDDYQCLAQFGFMIRDGGDGRVVRGPQGMPIMMYRLSKRSRRRLLAGAALLAELMLRADCSSVVTGLARFPEITSIAQARELASANLGFADFRLTASHPLGTAAMGANAKTGVVDFDHRVFGTQNLYIVDGSTVPTSLGVNPQMTIMAMATRAAERLLANSNPR